MIEIPELARLRVMLEYNEHELRRLRDANEMLRSALVWLLDDAKTANLKGEAVSAAAAVLRGKPIRIRQTEQQP